MVEMLMAAAILVVGLAGITSMMVGISSDTRSGVGRMNAASIATSAMQQTVAVGYCNLDAGTYDGGLNPDGAGRIYGTTVGIAAVGTVAEPTFQVNVSVNWTDGQRAPQVTNVSTLVSRPPDAGC